MESATGKKLPGGMPGGGGSGTSPKCFAKHLDTGVTGFTCTDETAPLDETFATKVNLPRLAEDVEPTGMQVLSEACIVIPHDAS